MNTEIIEYLKKEIIEAEKIKDSTLYKKYPEDHCNMEDIVLYLKRMLQEVECEYE